MIFGITGDYEKIFTEFMVLSDKNSCYGSDIIYNVHMESMAFRNNHAFTAVFRGIYRKLYDIYGISYFDFRNTVMLLYKKSDMPD